jgi:hypothetical protein
VVAGNYTVFEINIPASWQFDSFSCVNQRNQVKTSSNVTPPGTFTLKENEIVTCTFFDSLAAGSIRANKYHDHNGNGVDDGAGDEPLSGWTLFIDSNEDGDHDGGEPSGVTDASGEVLFSDVIAGTYQVCEVLDDDPGDDHEGWINTDPGASCSDPNGPCESVVVTAGQESTVDFGNFALRTKAGHKFEDLDGDGDLTDGVPLEGWTINLYADVNGDGALDAGDTLLDTDDTDADGVYSFEGLTAGTYFVLEACPTGWVQTFPNTDDDLDTCDYYTIEVGSGFSETDNDFGNFELGRIIVEKQTIPDGAPGEFEFTGEINTLLEDGESEDKGDLFAGEYTVSESDPSSILFALVSIECDDDDSDGVIEANGAGGTATYRLTSGEVITCVFTNAKQIHPETIGFWRNWRNHYTPAQFQNDVDPRVARWTPLHGRGERNGPAVANRRGPVRCDPRRGCQLDGPGDARTLAARDRGAGNDGDDRDHRRRDQELPHHTPSFPFQPRHPCRARTL